MSENTSWSERVAEWARIDAEEEDAMFGFRTINKGDRVVLAGFGGRDVTVLVTDVDDHERGQVTLHVEQVTDG